MSVSFRLASLAAVLALSLATQAAAAPDAEGGIAAQALDATAPPTTLAALAKVRPVVAQHAMVVSAQHLATQAGLQMLREGGNAMDAAVAVGYALAVVHPCCGNIGGGGYLVAHLADGRNLFLDFREKAPLAATPTLFQDATGKVILKRSTQGYLGVGVPGTVMGLNEALHRYGRLPLAKVMAPAIALAEKGYVLTPGDVNILQRRSVDFAKSPNVAAIFLHDGKPYQVGERLRQPQLAKTLRRIQSRGTLGFYKGAIAQALVKASRAQGGLLTQNDFDAYTVKWDRPVSCDYHGYRIISAPPPSSGGVTICEILQILAPYPLARWGYASVNSVHYLIEAERRAFADRNTHLGDPAFVYNPLQRLLSAQHIADLRASIQADRATPSSEIKGLADGGEGSDTTHYSVVDAAGNAVAVTYTLNYLFGIAQIAGNTGFFLNNEMDDFTSKPGVANTFGLIQGKANQIEGGKRPLSSMSPTVVLKRGKLYLVTGSPGGSTIISTTLQSFLNVAEFGMNIQQAVDAPRLHHQWYPDVVQIEPGLLQPALKAKLEAMGHRFHEIPAWGADEAILIDPVTGQRQGANDRRRPAGLAAGY